MFKRIIEKMKDKKWGRNQIKYWQIPYQEESSGDSVNDISSYKKQPSYKIKSSWKLESSWSK